MRVSCEEPGEIERFVAGFDDEVAAVIPFGYPAAEPLAAIDEDVDARIHVDGW